MGDNKVEKLSITSLDQVAGGFSTAPLDPDEVERYNYLMSRCEERGLSAVAFSGRVDDLTYFCREMKKKYGSAVDPENLMDRDFNI